MYTIRIKTKPGYTEWRQFARQCLNQEIPPTQIQWLEAVAGDGQATLALNELQLDPQANAANKHNVPKKFIDLAQTVCCHSDVARFALLYKILWRITHGEPKLLALITDDDVMAANTMAKSVGRDAYKMTAYVRFRELKQNDGDAHYLCWYEPLHYTLERSLYFFKTRFRNMRWSILTPYRAAHWDGDALTLVDNPKPDLVPTEDAVESYWLTYYASTFNPARLKIAAMMNQMPAHYWKNLPEAKLIPGLVKQANTRVATMINASHRV